MKRNGVLLVGALIAIVLGICWWLLASRRGAAETFRSGRPATQIADPSLDTKFQSDKADSRSIKQPRLFKSTRYPPQTPAEQELWEWWRAMNNSDPEFQWKMPIEFYGRVVDQFGEPVAGATVLLTWTAVDDAHRAEVDSDSRGRFELVGVRGKFLGVSIRKLGYLPTTRSGSGFEYAEFSSERFHVAVREEPVEFRLHKLLGADPMLKYITNREVVVGSDPIVLDVESGSIGTAGDLSFRITTGSLRGPSGPDFSIAVAAIDGAMLAATTDEFLFTAPEAGYSTSMVLRVTPSDPAYRRAQPYRFYVKTRSGKYAAVTGEITIREGLSEGMAGFHAIIFHNPSGSRNLEFDHRKWINR
jgi:hypothetical protein